jgi:glycosyltransferase involved in cell wall biosynthesis
MRVLQAMAGGSHGGAEAFFVRLALALRRAGLEQKIVIRTNPARAAELSESGIEAIQVPFGGRLDFVTPWRLKRVIRDFAPDIALTWMNRATRMLPEPTPAKPFVHVGRLGGYYDLKYYRRCRHLIGNTEDIVNYIRNEGWPPERVHYLPNFVAEAKAAPARRAEMFTPPDAPLVLAMGRLHENKGFDVLIETLARLPDVYLWIAGEGPRAADLEALAQRLFVKPRVRFLGWRDDAAALFAACDLFVCPSRHEPLGNVVIEAWAQGVAVIAAASQGPAALVRHGETGLLVPVDDAAALAGAIRQLLADRARAAALGRAGRAAFEQRFTEAIVVGRYLEFFRRVVA